MVALNILLASSAVKGGSVVAKADVSTILLIVMLLDGIHTSLYQFTSYYPRFSSLSLQAQKGL